MSFNEAKVITWERYEAQGFPHLRSRGTASRWELGYDGDGWCLSQDGALLEWYGVLDEAMAWVGEEEARHADGDDAIDSDGPRKIDDPLRDDLRSLLRLYDEVFRQECQLKRDFCAEAGESWFKNQADACQTSHWDALRAMRDRIEGILEADWRNGRCEVAVPSIGPQQQGD